MRGLWQAAGTAGALARATERPQSRIAPLIGDPLAMIADAVDFADLLGPARGDALLDAALRRLQGDTAHPSAAAPQQTHMAAAAGIRAAEPSRGPARPTPPLNRPPAARIGVAATDRIRVGAEILRAASQQVVAGRSLPDPTRAALRRLFAEAPLPPTPRQAPVAGIADHPPSVADAPGPALTPHAEPARGLSLLPRLVARVVPTPPDRHAPPPDLAAQPPAPHAAMITGFRGLAARAAAQAAAQSAPVIQPTARQPGPVVGPVVGPFDGPFDGPVDGPPRADPWAVPSVAPSPTGTGRAGTILPVPRPTPAPADPDIAETLARILRQEARRQGIRVGGGR